MSLGSGWCSRISPEKLSASARSEETRSVIVIVLQ
jgi:hypothetical protein